VLLFVLDKYKATIRKYRQVKNTSAVNRFKDNQYKLQLIYAMTSVGLDHPIVK